MTVLAVPTMEDLAVVVANQNLEIRSDLEGGFRLFRKVKHHVYLQEHLGDYPDLVTLWKAIR